MRCAKIPKKEKPDYIESAITTIAATHSNKKVDEKKCIDCSTFTSCMEMLFVHVHANEIEVDRIRIILPD